MAHNKERIPWDIFPKFTALFPEQLPNCEAADGPASEARDSSRTLDALAEAITQALEKDATMELARYEPFPEPAEPGDIVISDETAFQVGPILHYWRTANLVGPGHENLLTLPDEAYEIVCHKPDMSRAMYPRVPPPDGLSREPKSDDHDQGETTAGRFVYNAKWYQHISESDKRARARKDGRHLQRQDYYDNDTDGDDAYTISNSFLHEGYKQSAKLQRRWKAFLRQELACPPANVLCTHDEDFSCGCALPLRERRAEFLDAPRMRSDCTTFPEDALPELYRYQVIQTLIAVGDLGPLLRTGGGWEDMYNFGICNCWSNCFGWGNLGERCLYAYIFVNGLCSLGVHKKDEADLDYHQSSAWEWLISRALHDDYIPASPIYEDAFSRIHDEVLCSRVHARERTYEQDTVHYGKPYMHRLLPAFGQLQPDAADAAWDALSQKGLSAEIVQLVLDYVGVAATVRVRGDLFHPDNRQVRDRYLEWCWMTAVRCLALQAWIGCDEDGYPFHNSLLLGNGVNRIVQHFADPRSRNEEDELL